MKKPAPRARLLWIAIVGIVLLCISVVAAKTSLLSGTRESIAMPMVIGSPSFEQNGAIPTRYTCDGLNISPPLTWTGVPEGAKSLALIVDDPDVPNPEVPKKTWVHWVLYNIPPDSNGLPESVAAEGLPPGTLQGLNDWLNTHYQGPCQPAGRHRYVFQLYALDILLPDLDHPTMVKLEKAMQGHVLARSQFIGLYQR